MTRSARHWPGPGRAGWARHGGWRAPGWRPGRAGDCAPGGSGRWPGRGRGRGSAGGRAVRSGRPRRRGLFAYPAQSNFSGVQHPLRWIETAHEHGYDVLLDAAAYVPSNRLDLSVVKPDFVPVSWYKVFGYPTGVGCLIARREALGRLRRPWFAGGSVYMASVQGDWHTPAAGRGPVRGRHGQLLADTRSGVRAVLGQRHRDRPDPSAGDVPDRLAHRPARRPAPRQRRADGADLRARQYPRSRRHRRVQPAGSRRARRRRARRGAGYRRCRDLDPYRVLLQPRRRRGRVPTHQGRLAHERRGDAPARWISTSTFSACRAAGRCAHRWAWPRTSTTWSGSSPSWRRPTAIAWSTLAASHPGRAVKPPRASGHAMRMGRHREEVSWGLASSRRVLRPPRWLISRRLGSARRLAGRIRARLAFLGGLCDVFPVSCSDAVPAGGLASAVRSWQRLPAPADGYKDPRLASPASAPLACHMRKGRDRRLTSGRPSRRR